jgi:hypothetical protein
VPHEGPLALVYLDPVIVPWFLRNYFGLPLDDVVTAELAPTEVPVIRPGRETRGGRSRGRSRGTRSRWTRGGSAGRQVATYRSDTVVVLRNARGDPVCVVVVEVQREFDESKLTSWGLYHFHGRAGHGLPALLLVVTYHDSLPVEYANLIAATSWEGAQLRPRFVAPLMARPATSHAEAPGTRRRCCSHRCSRVVWRSGASWRRW